MDTSSLEAKVAGDAGKVQEAVVQLSAWYEDGVNRPSDLAFIQVEFPGRLSAESFKLRPMRDGKLESA